MSTLTLDQWEARLQQASHRVKALSIKPVNAAAKKGVGLAQGLVIVKSGRLQSTISIDFLSVDGNETVAEYSAKTPYAALVEFGKGSHSGKGPRPYMRPSAQVARTKLKRGAALIAAEALGAR